MRLLLSLLALLTTTILIYAIVCVVKVNTHEKFMIKRQNLSEPNFLTGFGNFTVNSQ